MVDNYMSESLALLRSINNHLATLVKNSGGVPAGQGDGGGPLDPIFIQSVHEEESTKSGPPSGTPFVSAMTVTPDTNASVPTPVVTPVVSKPAEKVATALVQSQPVAVANEEKSYAESFNELKELLESDGWPQAVDPDLICHDESDDDKELRAEGIIEFLIDEDLEGKRFLDFGCGEGHVVKKALEKKPVLSMGYDLHAQENWPTLAFPSGEKHGVTANWDDIVANGPYDVVLLYDVLDHLEGDHVLELRKLKSVMAPGGRIYIRCHPWCSRHATHLYKKVNKAFLHLVFSDVELARLGLGGGLKTAKIIHPHLVYKQWFNDSGLDLINENAIQENLEDFFHMNPIVNERIKDNWKGNSIDPQLAAGKGFPGYQLRIQFVDYLLKSA